MSQPSTQTLPPAQAAAQNKPATPPAAAKITRKAPKPAGSARMRGRHVWLISSFVLFVIIPLGFAAWYLYDRAVDQYVSRVGFAVRSEEARSALDLLGGLSASLSGSSSSDTDILYEYIQNREIIERIQQGLDLERMYSVPENDPIFAFEPTGNIEDLESYWGRMVEINYDRGNGLIELHVHAFEPKDAQAIAQAIVREATRLINELSAIAREDRTRYARVDHDQALERVKEAREALTRFRSATRIVDPTADIQGQMGLLNSLEAQLAETQIEMNLLIQTSRPNDPRIATAERRLSVIQELIEDERAKFGLAGGQDGSENYATLLGEFERLLVDREYAEEAFLSSKATLDAALAEAQRTSRYLATYIPPSLPQSSTAPKRETLLAILAAFLIMLWSVGALIYYSVRDRR